MKHKTLKLFGRTILYAFFGIVAGIILGFIFGFLIAWIGQEVFGALGEAAPLEVGTFFGMGAGAIIAGIFGGVIGYKD